MRDTYSIGLMHVSIAISRLSFRGTKRARIMPAPPTTSADEYNADVSTIFNNINHLDAFNAFVKKIDANSKAEFYTDKIVDEVQTALIDRLEGPFLRP
jgi:hypothetical protein